MVYNSFNFLVLFPLIFLLYYVIPAKYPKARNWFLLQLSYALYISWKPAFALVLLGVSLVTYWGGQVLEFKDESSKFKVRRKRLVWCFAILGLLPLLVFKYYNFINDSITDGLSSIGVSLHLPGLNWAIPIGISFFTFQAVGYMLDVYHGRIKAERNLLDYLLFVSFFPSILSGPINKASLVLPQIKSLRPYFDYSKAVAGLKMILWGMFMKVVVADRVALYVDTVLPSYMNYTGVTCFAASLFYTIQIYADFAGYSLMALGVGKVLGFELTENFRRPYFAVSITDFWHRWHISLSTWLKDYVYIPLGGSRCSKARNYWNIFVTFLVSGIWHGANWTFIVWGCMHGICQIFEKMLGLQKLKSGNGFIKFGRILITFLLVNFAWIFFRMPSLGDALGVIGHIFDVHQSMALEVTSKHVFLLMMVGTFILVLKDVRDEFAPNRFKLFESRFKVVRWVSYVAVIVLIMLTGVFDAGQFIYANF